MIASFNHKSDGGYADTIIDQNNCEFIAELDLIVVEFVSDTIQAMIFERDTCELAGVQYRFEEAGEHLNRTEEEVTSGVYLYKVDVVIMGQGQQQFYGSVTLIR